MRIRALSRLHREIGTADLLDIDRGIMGVAWARHEFPSIPALHVAGNHEHYDERIGRLHEKLREAAASSNALPNQRNRHDGPRSETARNSDFRTTAIER